MQSVEACSVAREPLGDLRIGVRRCKAPAVGLQSVEAAEVTN